MVAEGMDFNSLRKPKVTVDQYIDRFTPPNDINLDEINRINLLQGTLTQYDNV